jgi:hypothetical protein
LAKDFKRKYNIGFANINEEAHKARLKREDDFARFCLADKDVHGQPRPPLTSVSRRRAAELIKDELCKGADTGSGIQLEKVHESLRDYARNVLGADGKGDVSKRVGSLEPKLRSAQQRFAALTFSAVLPAAQPKQKQASAAVMQHQNLHEIEPCDSDTALMLLSMFQVSDGAPGTGDAGRASSSHPPVSVIGAQSKKVSRKAAPNQSTTLNHKRRKSSHKKLTSPNIGCPLSIKASTHWFQCRDGRGCGRKGIGAGLCLCNWADGVTIQDLEEADWRCAKCEELNSHFSFTVK